MTLYPNFPAQIDASARSTFAACPRQFFFRSVMKKTAPGTSIHLTFGGAMAKGLEIVRRRFYEDGISLPEALDEGSKALIKFWLETDTPQDFEGAKNIKSCVRALEDYFKFFDPTTDYMHPMKYSDGKRAVEFTFAIPLSQEDGFPLHPQTNLPILYTGRFDMLGETNSGAKFIVDDKTTGQLGMNFTKSMKMRSQFTGYKWACDQFGIDTAGVVIRATNPLMRDIKFAEITEMRPDHMVAQWYHQLRRDVCSMVQQWAAGSEGDFLKSWSANLDDSCGSYGGCPFLEACLSPKPLDVIAQHFTDNDWDPLKKDI